MKRDTEYRYIDAQSDAQIRAHVEDDTQKMIVRGYAIVWDVMSQPIGGEFREIIRRESVTKTLQEGDQRAFLEHNKEKLLGVRSNNTLTLNADDHGLHFEIVLPNTTSGRDTYELTQRGDLRHMSFGFIPIEDNISGRSDDGYPIREVKEMRLLEISVVDNPAYLASTAQARSIVEAAQTGHGTSTQAPEPEFHASAERAEQLRALQLYQLKQAAK